MHSACRCSGGLQTGFHHDTRQPSLDLGVVLRLRQPGPGQQRLHLGGGLSVFCQARHAQIALAASTWPRRPRVYFEEWDEPMISAIRWVSELVTVAGGDDVFPELALQSMGRDRVIADALAPARRAPDVIIGSWCGKKFRPEKVAARAGWAEVRAVRDGELHEIKSCDILQPGPAALTDGLEKLHAICARWAGR